MNNNAFKFSLVLLTVTSSLFISLNPIAAPKYLRDLDIEIKDINKQASLDAWNQLKNKKTIAIKSLKNGGYVYATSESDNQIIKTLKSEGTYTRLAYVYNTPQETHFIVVKSKTNGVIYLKSMFMEGKVLACDTSTDKIIFKSFDEKDETQKWVLKSGDGLNQVYFKNKDSKDSSCFLSIDGEKSKDEKSSENIQEPLKIGAARQVGPCMNCTSTDAPTKSELFKIIELD
ncbi:MAG: hypothetical protein V1646_00695 [bacterium]